LIFSWAARDSSKINNDWGYSKKVKVLFGSVTTKGTGVPGKQNNVFPRALIF
jgi:hypothetical protein